MAISDEIIELEPVKKTKSKLIIMFVIMGVLLALAVTFLVLYFLKPAPVVDNGKIVGVETTSSQLFTTTDEDGNIIKKASVGNEYTVYATLSVTGGKEAKIKWICQPENAITVKDHGIASSGTEGVQTSADDSGYTKFFCTFSPNVAFAGQTIKLIAVSESTNDGTSVSSTVDFTIVRQGTEYLTIDTYRKGSSSASKTTISGAKIELPWYTKDSVQINESAERITANETYYVDFSQYGEYDPSTNTYSKISEDQTTNSADVKLEVVSGGAIFDATPTVNQSGSRFSFKLVGVGEAVIKLSANQYNDYGNKEVVQTLTVKSISSESLGLIDGIYYTDQPVTAETIKTLIRNGQTPTQAKLTTKKMTIPFGVAEYDNVLSHIIITPYSLQYDSSTGKLKDDWKSRIKVASSNSAVCSYNKSTDGIYANKKLTDADDCKLTFTDTTTNGLGVRVDVELIVVAPVKEASVQYSYDKTDYKAITSTAESIYDVTSATAIDTIQNKEYTATVTYKVDAPTNSDTKTLINYLYGGYVITADKSFVSVKTSKGTKIELGKEQKFSADEITFKSTGGNSYTGTAKFIVTVNSGVSTGSYALTFKKLGIQYGIDMSKRINKNNPTITLTQNFSIDSVATSASFVSNDQIKKVITKNNTQAASFENTTAANEKKNYSANIYVQLGTQGSLVSNALELENLITASSAVNITSTVLSVSNMQGTTNIAYNQLKFSDSVNGSAIVKSIVKNKVGDEIATFTFSIKLVDAIESISCGNATVQTLNYSASSLKSFSVDTITQKYVTSTATKTLTKNDYTVKLYYLEKGGKVELTSATAANNVTTYSLGNTILFKYNRDTNNIEQVADLFEVAYKNDLSFSSIYIEYTLNTDSYANYEQASVSCEREYKFIRLADDVMLYESDVCSEDNRATSYDSSSGKFNCEVNQTHIGRFAVSAVIVLSDSTKVYVQERIEDNDVLPETQAVYMVLPENTKLQNYSGTEYDGVTNAYTVFRYTAPSILTTTDTTSFDIYLAGGTSRKAEVNLTINNKSRKVTNVQVLEGSTPITSLDFGLFNTSASESSNYEKTITVKVKYEASNIDNTYFETVTVELPEYLSYKVGDGENTTWESGSFSISAPISDIMVSNSGEGYEYTQNVTVKVNKDSSKHSGLTNDEKITLSPRTNTVSAISVGASVGVGVKSIAYKCGDESYPDDTSFTLNISSSEENKDEQNKRIDFTVTTLAGELYANIKYDYNKLNITSQIYQTDKLTEVNDSPLLIEVSNELDEIWIKVNPENKKTGKYYVKLTFVDTAGGANKTFTVGYNVTVNALVYKLSVKELDTDTNLFNVVTTGEKATEQTINFTLKVNEDNANFIPPTDVISNISVTLVAKNGDTYSDYTNAKLTVKAVAAKEGKYYLTVSNDLLKLDSSVYIKISHGSVVEYVPVTLTTSAHYLELAEGNSVTVKDGKANITVQNSTQEFKLAGVIKNSGTNAIVSDKTVTYKLYKDESHTTLTSSEAKPVAAIDAYGNIKLLNPDVSGTGTIYYCAIYNDETSGESYEIDVAVTYYVTVASVSVKIDGTEYNTSNAITLHYLDGTHYTTIDLNGCISYASAFSGVAIYNGEGVAIAITSNNTDFVVINDKKIYAVNSGSSETLTITVTATLNGISVTKDVAINIIKFNAPSVSNTDIELNVVNGETSTIMPTISNDTFVKYTYTIMYDTDKFNVTPDSGDYTNTSFTVSTIPSAFTNGSDYKAYTFTIAVTYYNVASSCVFIGEPLQTTFTVTPTWTIGDDDVSFLIKDTTKNELYSDGATITHDDGSTYVAFVNYVTSATESSAYATALANATYTLKSDNVDIVNVGDGVIDHTSGKTLSLGNGYGMVNLIMTVSVYGRSKDVTLSYTVTYGGSATVAMSTSTDGGSTWSSVEDNDSFAVDFEGATTDKCVRYYIDASLVGATVKVNDINLSWNGDVDIEKDGENLLHKDTDNKYYALFIPQKAGKLSVQATIRVSGRIYYTDLLSLELTANEPDFAISLTQSGNSRLDEHIHQSADATLSVSANDGGYLGGYAVSYVLKNGSGYVDLEQSVGDNGATVKSKLNAQSDVIVTIVATITVTDGALKGNVYTVEKSWVLVGISLPTLSAKYETIKVNVGDTVDLATDKTVLIANGSACSSYDYSNKLTYSYSVSSSSFTQSTDYTVSGSTLMLESTDTVKAGGKLKVTVTATVKSGCVNAGETISCTYYVVVTPQVQAIDGKSISAQKGSYDLNSIVVPYTSSDSSQINSGDLYTVSLAFASNMTGTVKTTIGENRPIASVFELNGDELIIKENVLQSCNLQFVATVKMTTGAYAGTTMSCSAYVTVNGFSIVVNTDAEKITYNTSTHSFNSVTIKGGSSTSTNTEWSVGVANVSSITVTTDCSYVTIENNGTTEPKLNFDNRIGGLSSITLSLDVVADGKTYYGECSAKVDKFSAVGLVVTDDRGNVYSVSNDAPYVEAYYIEMAAGETLTLTFTETHNLSITSLSITDPSDGWKYISCYNSGATALFCADKTTSDGYNQLSIEFTIDGWNETPSFSFVIKVNALAAARYTVTNSNANVTTSAKTLKTVWVNNFIDDKNGWNKVEVSTNKDRLLISATIMAYYVGGGSVSETKSLYQSDSDKKITFNNSYLSNTLIYFELTVVFRYSNNLSFNVDTYYESNKYFTQPYTVAFGTPIITLDANGGELSSESTIYATNGAYSNLPTPTRDGYNFLGWYSSYKVESSTIVPTTDTRVESGTVNCNTTFYAMWELAGYSLTLNPSGGTIDGSQNSITTAELKVGETYALLADYTPIKTGYTFDGWYNADNELITSFTVMTIGQITKTELTARWTANKYQVTLNACGGDFGASQTFTMTVSYGGSYGSLLEPKRSGYRFDGWYTQENGGTKVESSTVVANAQNHTLYAKWSAYTINITLNLNGGTYTGSQSNVSIGEIGFGQPYGTQLTTVGDAVLKEGYTFVGWYLNLNEGNKIMESSLMTMTTAHTLYAKWEAKLITVTLDANGGTINGLNGTILATYDSTYSGLASYTAAKVKKAGYTFDGWYTAKNNGELVTTKTIVDSTSNITLYAHWTANTYDIGLYVNSDSESADYTVTVTYDGKFGYLPTPTKDGYVFNGWYSGKNGTGTQYVAESKVPFEQNGSLTCTKLYASWTVQTYLVILDANGGKFDDDNTIKLVQLTYGQTFADCITDLPINYGSELSSLNTNAGGNGTTYELTDTVGKFVNGSTLYCTWNPKTVTITFKSNADGVTVEGEEAYETTGTFGEKVVTPSTPTRLGYTFLGWYTEEADGGKIDFNSFIVYNEEGHTFYAHWQNDVETEQSSDVDSELGE